MLPPGAIVTSGSKLLLRTMSGSAILLQAEYVLMFVAYIATKDHMDA